VITIWPSAEIATSAFVAIAVAEPVVKRLHDINKPGAYYWLTYIPIVNLIIGIMLLFKKGTVGANQYGDDPLSTNNEK
jgi:uncharacterized membrane protein YhaH (DUF805 family)